MFAWYKIPPFSHAHIYMGELNCFVGVSLNFEIIRAGRITLSNTKARRSLYGLKLSISSLAPKLTPRILYERYAIAIRSQNETIEMEWAGVAYPKFHKIPERCVNLRMQCARRGLRRVFLIVKCNFLVRREG